MYAYHVYYDLKQNKFVMEDDNVELGHSSDFSKYFSHLKVAEIVMKKLNKEVPYCIKKCSQCGRIFWLDEDEQDWYNRKNLHHPRKCNTCRNMAKNLRKEKEYYA